VADNSHKRDTNARRKPTAVQLAGSLAVLATGAAVVAGISLQSPEQSDLVAADSTTSESPSATTTPSTTASPDARVERRRSVSRAQERRAAISDAEALVGATRTAKTARESATKTSTTETLNLWTAPGNEAVEKGEVEAAKIVYSTGQSASGRQEIVYDNEIYWVTSGYLDDEKPEPETGASGGINTAPCAAGASAESGITPSAVTVLRSVCHNFPQITTYGGYDPHGEHADGRAIDIMTSDKALGDEIAAFLQTNASALNVRDIIWWQQIWTPVRASEGWRYYGDYGSPTANHMDHVHVAVN